jgi:hypothetical protein
LFFVAQASACEFLNLSDEGEGAGWVLMRLDSISLGSFEEVKGSQAEACAT